MKILIDIGHPAHVHYFRHLICKMKDNGHKFMVIARDKEMSHYLLKKYNISYISRGKGANGALGKLLYMIKADLFLLGKALKFRPDIFISFSSFYAAHVSFLMNKPHVVLDDTEHSKLEQKLYKPFSDIIINPVFFRKNMGEKQIKVNSLFELCYLHPNYFKPDDSIKNDLGVGKNEKYIVLRFIAWQASHDKNQKGISNEIKRKAISEFKKFGKVFISSEGDLPKEFEPYKLHTPPEKIHHVLYYASLFFSESGTMATESAILGTPVVNISTLASSLGNFQDLQNIYNLMYYYDSDLKGLEKALELIENNQKENWAVRREAFLKNKVDITSLLIWFIENYPDSRDIMKENPDYQVNFV